MFTGDYGFFDYKYNIPGYSGQDYGGPAQYVYLGVSAVLLVLLIIAFRRAPEQRVRRTLGWLGVFLTLFYIGKTAWESYYDITLSGAFNTWLLPFDACSFIMPAGILAGFSKGRVQRAAESWVATGGVVGGIANMLFLRALYYYPFFSFGAVYSMLWHFLMVFMGVLVLASHRPPVRFSLVLSGFAFHLAASAIVIPIDFIYGFDFMLYRELGGVPFFEGVASSLAGRGMAYLNPVLMLALYFAAFTLVWSIAALFKNRGVSVRTGSK